VEQHSHGRTKAVTRPLQEAHIPRRLQDDLVVALRSSNCNNESLCKIPKVWSAVTVVIGTFSVLAFMLSSFHPYVGVTLSFEERWG
jgi:hypothetical protein